MQNHVEKNPKETAEKTNVYMNEYQYISYYLLIYNIIHYIFNIFTATSINTSLFTN